MQQFRGDLAVTGNADADDLVNTDPVALLVAMLLDQQIPLEWAFAGPQRLAERLGTLDPATIAELEPDDVVAAATTKPALHRFPAAMGRRIHELMVALGRDFDNDPTLIWSNSDASPETRPETSPDAERHGDIEAETVMRRLRSLPGFGDEKAMITIAVLAKRFGIRPRGWQDAAGPFADDEPRSAADIHDAASHARVREWKKRQRAAGRTKQDRPPNR